MAKGLGSGMPISAVASTRAIMDKWLPGTHGGTYGGGNALAATAARETIAIMLEEDLPAEAARKGALLMGLLTEVQQEFPVVGDVRGRGLMVATEFTRADGTPDPDTTAKVAKGCVDGGLLMLTCGTFGNVIRWVPPLVVTDHELREAVAIFRRSLAAAAGS
jgi:4-aminobutyrate aminotransferase